MLKLIHTARTAYTLNSVKFILSRALSVTDFLSAPHADKLSHIWTTIETWSSCCRRSESSYLSAIRQINNNLDIKWKRERHSEGYFFRLQAFSENGQRQTERTATSRLNANARLVHDRGDLLICNKSLHIAIHHSSSLQAAKRYNNAVNNDVNVDIEISAEQQEILKTLDKVITLGEFFARCKLMGE